MRTQACKSLGWSFSIQNVVLVPAISASPEVYWAFLKSQSKSMYQNLQVTYRGYSLRSTAFSSVQFSCSVVSDSLWPHESQHARPPYPSPTPGIHSDSRPSSQWCHPAISSSVIPFSSCPQSLPASESFPMGQHFAWGGQSTGASALASFLPKKSQGWSPSEWTGWISLQSKGLSRVFSNTTVQKHQFFSAQLWYSLEVCISNGYIFPFLPCLWLVFYSQLLARPP